MHRTPSHGTPSHGTPSHGTPSHGTPSHGIPAQSSPSYGTAAAARIPGPRSAMSRRRFLGSMAVAAGAAAVGGPSLGGLRPAAASGVTAGTASSLSDMFGVVTITSRRTGAWGNHDLILSRLQEVGAKVIRDCLYDNVTSQWAFLGQLASAGIGSDLMMGTPLNSSGTPEQLVEIAASKLTGVRSFEGANEWNLSGRSTWVSELKAHQTRLYRAVKADGRVADRRVLAPSLGRRSNFTDLGDISSICDNGNLHLYPGGFPPSNRVDEQLQNAAIVAPGKPVIFTECGYHDAVNSTATHFYTPDDITAVYAPRLLLEHYLRGVRHSFVYELLDRAPDPGLTDHEDHFGLLHTDFTRKPQFNALKNLMALVSDPGSSAFTPSTLSYSLASAPSDLRQVLLQRSDGSHLLFLWRDVSIYDPAHRVRLSVAPATVRLSLGSAASVSQYRPTTGTSPTNGVSRTTSTSVTLSSEVVALHVERA